MEEILVIIRRSKSQGLSSFRVCDGSLGLDKLFCPKDKPHGHFWGNSELPVSFFPVLTNKTLALEILFELCDLLGGDALEHHPVIERVKEEIANSGLPEDKEE